MFTTADFLRFIAVILALPGAFFFIRALGRAKSSRTAAYYATRRKAAHASNRDLSSFFIIAIIATVLAIISIFLPAEITTPEQQAQVAVTNTTTTPTAIPRSTSIATTQTTPAPATTATPAPALTPTPFATAIRVTPTEKPVDTGSPIHKLALYAISSAITTGGLPISPTTEFSSRVPVVYIFYEYASVQQSVLIRQIWLRDGNGVYYDTSTWSHTGSGYGYISWAPRNGFDPGLYEVRVMLGDYKQFSANFVVH